MIQTVVVVAVEILIIAAIALIFLRRRSKQISLLRNTHGEHELLLEHNLAGVCRTTIDGRVLDANQTTLDTLGYARLQDILGVDIKSHYWFAEDRIRMVENLQRSGMLRGIEVCMKRTNGESFWALYNVILIQNPAVSRKEVIAIAMDINAIKQTEDELKSAKERAEAANRAKDQFLANMSHELRTPLNGILGLTELAMECDLSPEVRNLLQDVSTAGNGLLRIVGDVLDYSKLQVAGPGFEVAAFSLSRTLEESISSVDGVAELKHLSLTWNCQTQLPPFVWGDIGRLRRILRKLLENAIKFTDKGGVAIEVRTEDADEEKIVLHILISDSGIGIPEEKLESIFHAFVQVDESDTRRFGGTGLGLAIAVELARSMAGELWAESTLGAGSTFHLRVPLRTQPPMERYPNSTQPVGITSVQ